LIAPEDEGIPLKHSQTKLSRKQKCQYTADDVNIKEEYKDIKLMLKAINILRQKERKKLLSDIFESRTINMVKLKPKYSFGDEVFTVGQLSAIYLKYHGNNKGNNTITIIDAYFNREVGGSMIPLLKSGSQFLNSCEHTLYEVLYRI